MADSTTAPIQEEVLKALALAAVAVVVLVAVGLWWAVRHPVSALTLTAVAAVGVEFGPGAGLVAVATVAVVLAGWRWLHRASFDWFVVGRWRRLWVYGWRWRKTLTMSGLGDTYRPHTDPLAHEPLPTKRYVPKLGRVRSDRWCDRVSVRLLVGQHPGMFADHTDHLAHAFGAIACRVEVPAPGRVVLVFQHRDPLARIVPALPIPDGTPDLRGLPVGVLEDGRPWTVQLAGSHLLVGGASGAGKGSVIWSLIRAVAPAVHEGNVQLWCVDPKGGMELSAGAAMFTRFAYDDPAEMADLLDDAVEALHKRAHRLRAAGLRKHTPTGVEPLVVVVVDEMAFLTAYQPDRDIKKRITAALSVLLSKGRAVGFSVVAALQDPRKEVLPFRDLFPTRVALRLTEPEQSRIMLSTGAHDRGAECERIPVHLPGVGYVLLDGLTDPTRVRAGWVTDTDITAMADRYPARRGDVIDATTVDAATGVITTDLVSTNARETAA
jgi:S-DNA-T family DNA segregation ATPase FtsK/SpoIIIE